MKRTGTSGSRRFFSTARPLTRLGPVEPMSDEDAEFWRLLRERRSESPARSDR